MGAKLRKIIILIHIIYMPQFDETSPLNEICVLAFEKKKKNLNLNKQKKGFGYGVIPRYCTGCKYSISTHIIFCHSHWLTLPYNFFKNF